MLAKAYWKAGCNMEKENKLDFKDFLVFSHLLGLTRVNFS